MRSVLYCITIVVECVCDVMLCVLYYCGCSNRGCLNYYYGRIWSEGSG